MAISQLEQFDLINKYLHNLRNLETVVTIIETNNDNVEMRSNCKYVAETVILKCNDFIIL